MSLSRFWNLTLWKSTMLLVSCPMYPSLCVFLELLLKSTLVFIGKVTSLISRKNLLLANRIEEAIMKNESLESLSVDRIKRDIARSNINQQKGHNEKREMSSTLKRKTQAASTKPSEVRGKTAAKKSYVSKSTKAPTNSNPKKKVVKFVKTSNSSGSSSSRGRSSSGKKHSGGRSKEGGSSAPKLNVVGFRGRSSVKTAWYVIEVHQRQHGSLLDVL